MTDRPTCRSVIKRMLLLFLDRIGPAVYHRRKQMRCRVSLYGSTGRDWAVLPCCIWISVVCESTTILVTVVMVNEAVDMVEFH